MREEYTIQGNTSSGDRAVGGAEAFEVMQTWNAAHRSKGSVNSRAGGLSVESAMLLVEVPGAVVGTLAAGPCGPGRRSGSRGVPRETMIPADRKTRSAPHVAPDERGRVRCRSSIE